MTDITTLGYYDCRDRTRVIADASPFALGAVLRLKRVVTLWTL